MSYDVEVKTPSQKFKTVVSGVENLEIAQFVLKDICKAHGTSPESVEPGDIISEYLNDVLYEYRIVDNNSMTPEEFKTIRITFGLSQSQMAKALRLNSSRAVRAYELGERTISGPIARHMEEFREGKAL